MIFEFLSRSGMHCMRIPGKLLVGCGTIRQDPDLVDLEGLLLKSYQGSIDDASLEWLSGWPVQLELDKWRHS
jgi:hypothetical protein